MVSEKIAALAQHSSPAAFAEEGIVVAVAFVVAGSIVVAVAFVVAVGIVVAVEEKLFQS